MQEYTWFFSLEKPLTEHQRTALLADFDRFVAQWQTHGKPVDGLIRLFYDLFVVIQSNPTDARPSGCSIDSLRRGVEQLLTHHGAAWVDPTWVFYRDKENAIQRVQFQQVPTLVSDGTLTADSTMFDHSLGQSDDLNRWEVPMSSMWLKRYLPKEQQA